MNEEVGIADQDIEVVLRKFDGDVDADPDAVLREKVVILNGEIQSHEFYDEQGQLTKTIEGGDNGTN